MRKILNNSEIKFLRAVAGYALADRERSKDIRQKSNIFNLKERIKEYTNNWKIA